MKGRGGGEGGGRGQHTLTHTHTHKQNWCKAGIHGAAGALSERNGAEFVREWDSHGGHARAGGAVWGGVGGSAVGSRQDRERGHGTTKPN